MRILIECCSLALLAVSALAQQPASAIITGKLAAVEAKGKTAVLKVKDDAGTEHRFDVTPKVSFEIQSAGDDDFFAPGLFVRIDAIQSNNALFGTTFQIYPDQPGKLPPAKAVKAPPTPGQSQEQYFVSGEIARFEKVEDAKYNLLHLKINPKSELTVYIEPDHSVKIVQTDPQKAVVGQAVTVEGRLAGTKLLPAKIAIDTGETLKADEFLANRKGKK